MSNDNNNNDFQCNETLEEIPLLVPSVSECMESVSMTLITIWNELVLTTTDWRATELIQANKTINCMLVYTLAVQDLKNPPTWQHVCMWVTELGRRLGLRQEVIQGAIMYFHLYIQRPMTLTQDHLALLLMSCALLAEKTMEGYPYRSRLPVAAMLHIAELYHQFTSEQVKQCELQVIAALNGDIAPTTPLHWYLCFQRFLTRLTHIYPVINTMCRQTFYNQTVDTLNTFISNGALGTILPSTMAATILYQVLQPAGLELLVTSFTGVTIEQIRQCLTYLPAVAIKHEDCKSNVAAANEKSQNDCKCMPPTTTIDDDVLDMKESDTPPLKTIHTNDISYIQQEIKNSLSNSFL